MSTEPDAHTLLSRRLGDAASLLFAATLALSPLVGIGLSQLLLGRSSGTGIQPAFVSAGALLLLLTILGWPRPGTDGWRLVAATAWTVLLASALWLLDDMGLAGERPWSKGLKQCVQLVFFVALAFTPSVLLARTDRPLTRLLGWERALSVGLLMAGIFGLYQALAFYLELPGAAMLERITTSNPSIGSGSGELFLGHRFVGIPRVRSSVCEPLYFGSYLLFALPASIIGAMVHNGWGRVWRFVAVVVGSICLVMTFSRGVYLALFVQFVFLAVGARKGVIPRPTRRVLLGVLIGGGIGGGLVLWILTGKAPWELPLLLIRRMGQSFADHDLSNLTRLYSWRAALSMFAGHPLLGVGWGGFGFWFYRVAGEGGAVAAFGWPVTNSIPLRLLAETGATGLVLWTLAMLPTVRGLGPLVGKGRTPATFGVSLSFVLATSAVAFMVQSLTFSQLNLPHLWLFMGIVAAVSRHPEEMV